MTEVVKICEWCGKEFIPNRDSQRFCSNACSGTYNSKHRQPKGPLKECIICGEKFSPYHGRQVTCGKKECAKKHISNLKKKKKYKYPKKPKSAVPTPPPSTKDEKSWGRLSASERWEKMTLTELSAEISRLFPGKSYGEVRILKEQGKLPKDFGKGCRKNAKNKRCSFTSENG